MSRPFVVPASWCGFVVGVLMDEEDALALSGRLAIGSHGYAQLYVNRKVTLLHRYLLGLQPKDRMVGDHINRAVLDNRRTNLRVVDASHSNLNRSSADSPTVGVYLNPAGRWEATFKWRRHKHHVGTFADRDEAVRARAAAKAAAFAAESSLHPQP